MSRARAILGLCLRILVLDLRRVRLWLMLRHKECQLDRNARKLARLEAMIAGHDP